MMRPGEKGFVFVLAIILTAVVIGCGGDQKNRYGTIEGRTLTPLEEVYIHVYPAGDEARARPLLTVGPTGPDGEYTLSLEPGEYLLVARKRLSGEESGPLLEGDLKSEAIGPIKITAGGTATVDAVLRKKIGNLKEAPLASVGGKSGIEGRILDEDGNPVPDVRVQVYTYVQMSERPKHVSEKTGPDGRYRIYLPSEGTYYLSARNNFGGPPKIGDLYGRYDRGTIDPSAVYVKEGEVVSDVDIVVHKIW